MSDKTRERKYSTNLYDLNDECQCYCQKKTETNTKNKNQNKNCSIFSYIYQELLWGQRSLSQDDAIYKKRCEKVYTFIRIPGKIESLMFYGLLCCLDIFVSLFTFIPLRCCLTLLKTVTWPIWRPFLGPKRFIFQSQVMDIARVVLILITCISPWSPIVSVNTSVIYHTIRGQELLKLYIIFNMLEVADRLIASVGQDTMDTFFWTLSNPRPFRLIFHFAFAVLYMFVHSFIMLLQATTLNVAFNNHNKVLLLIMMSNNFIEIKGSVFKKFEKHNLFQVTCADIRERFHLFWLLYIVLIRSLSQHDWSIEAVEDIVVYIAVILFAELIIDWMKHAFIVKFNNLSVDIYPEYRATLTKEYIQARNPKNGVEHADLISRRMAFSPLPLAAVVISMSRISLFSKLSGSISVQITIMLLINLFLLKLITGLILMVKSEPHLKTEAKNSAMEEIPPKLEMVVDPFEQLKRRRSQLELKKTPEKESPVRELREQSSADAQQCQTCK